MSLLEHPLRRLAASPLARAATWPHGVDGFAGLVDPAWSTDGVRARITGIRRQTADTVTLALRPNGNWTGHRAGQHVLLTVEVDGVRRTRCFSVASAPGDPVIELTCKVGPSSVVARHLRERAAVGDVVELSPAQGEFVLDPSTTDRPLLLVSAGSGITPVLSMLRALDRAGDARPVTFVHYARSGHDVLHPADVAQLVARHPAWRAITVTEHDGTGDLEGRFHPDHLDAAGIAPGEADAYVCGPAPFMDAVADAWQAAGGAPDRFHTESFGAPAPISTGPVGCRLRFTRSGIDLVSDGRPILEQAEAAGLHPRHGCRRGICHTCVVPVDGTPVRICITVPDGDVELDL
jgi:ferredoxin-NADP reductase